MGYKRLTLEQRYEIKAYLQCGKTKKFIAGQLGVHPSTIGREIKRNQGKNGNYNPKNAQEYTNIRKERFAKERKFTKKMKIFVEEKIGQEQWSPEQIVGSHYIKPLCGNEIYFVCYVIIVCGGQKIFWTYYNTFLHYHKNSPHKICEESFWYK